MSATEILVVVGGVLAILSAAYAFGRGAWAWFRRLSHFIDDVTGEDARPGQPRRPGLVEQVDMVRRRQEEIAATAAKAAEDAAVVRHELTLNGGTSVKDVVNKTARRLDEHINNHEHTTP